MSPPFVAAAPGVSRRIRSFASPLSAPQTPAYVSTPALAVAVNELAAAGEAAFEQPLYVTDLGALAEAAQQFIANFPGDVAYAVKCNPDPVYINALVEAGIDTFDVASLAEMALVYSIMPQAKLYFMHPVKSRDAIARAYHDFGVRAFVLDTHQELDKIVAATGNAADLELFVRVALPKNASATIDFSGKFGATRNEAISLLRAARKVSAKLGIAFHVGTQTVAQSAYDRALGLVRDIIAESGVKVDVLDIGGGFPADYDGTQRQHKGRIALLRHIRKTVLKHGLGGMELVCEPGRALVARAQSLVLRVEQRRGDTLYLNDGTYGGLADSGAVVGQAFPVRCVTKNANAGLQAFTVYGPTCDSLDKLAMPLLLPANIGEGDLIEFGHTGAYSQSLRTDFNGFGATRHAIVTRTGEITE